MVDTAEISEDDLKRFQPLGDYDWPSSSVDRGAGRALGAFFKRIFTHDDTSGIDADRLNPATKKLLDQVAAPPAIQPLMRELTATLEGWIKASSPSTLLQTIILPPCDREAFLAAWAEKMELPVIPADASLEDVAQALQCDAAACLPVVIAKLETRFLRTADGLKDIRALIGLLATTRRKVIIGCNSWAWQFLVKSCEIDSVLSTPLTLAAFDRERLAHWLASLSDKAAQNGYRFKLAKNGRDVFSGPRDEDPSDSYMGELARKSLGIPWIAWSLWRSSLRTESASHDTDRDAKTLSDVDTFWISELSNYALPDRHDQNALLVLHTLLIHGELSPAQIEATVPLPGYTNVLNALTEARLIVLDDNTGTYHCAPVAYPSIRDGLRLNGYPMDVL